MPNAFTIEIKGQGAIAAHFKKLGKRIQEGIQDELEVAAFEISDKAIRYITTNGAIDQGFLKNSQQVTRDKQQRGWIVANTAVYAPFVEFGTKTKVKVPAEWATYAQQFKGYKGLDNVKVFRQSILEWIRRKHIRPIDPRMTEEGLAYLITLHILKFGIDARPFMYPAYKEVTTDLPLKIERVVNRLLAP